MGKVQKKHKYLKYLIKNDKSIGTKVGTKENIASMFNEFFTNVGPDLAKNITIPSGASVFDYLKNRNRKNRNDNCMFLSPGWLDLGNWLDVQ